MKSLRKGVLLIAFAIAMFASFVVGGLVLGRTGTVKAEDTFVFEMAFGTSAKLTEKEGLRFRVAMDEKTKDNIVKNDDISLSFLISPLFNMREIMGENYQDLPQHINVQADKTLIYEESGLWYSNCVLTDVYPANRKLDFACIAYLEENGTRTYATKGYSYNNLYATLNSVVLDTTQNYVDKILGSEVVKYVESEPNGFLYDWFGKVNDNTSENYAIVVSTQEQYDTLVSRVKNNDKIDVSKMLLKLDSKIISSKEMDGLSWTEVDTSSSESGTFFVEFKYDGKVLKKVSVEKGGKVSAPILNNVTDNDGNLWEYGVWKDGDGNPVDFSKSIYADTVYNGSLIRRLNLAEGEYALNNGRNKITVNELGNTNEIIKISYASECKDLTATIDGKTITFMPKEGVHASGKIVFLKIAIKDSLGNYYNVYKKIMYNFDGCVLENSSDMVDLYENFPDYYKSDIKLISDINMAGVDTINKSWKEKIAGNYYSGVFDGQNHVISNLNTWAGIIPNIGEKGVIKNLALTNMYSSATNGGFAVHLNNGTIENCYFEGRKKADNNKDNVAFCYFNGGVHKISNVVVIMSKDDTTKNQSFGITRGTVPTNWNNVYVVNDGCNGYECGTDLDASTHKDINGAYLYTSIDEMKADIKEVPSGFDKNVWTISASGELVMKCAEKTPDVVISNKDEFIKWYKDDFMNVYDKSQYVVLTADIDLSGFSYNPGDSRKNAEFNGIFDGNGHTISNLTTGFGILSSVAPSGIIKNVSFVNYTATNVWSPFVGNWLKGSMNNVYIEGQFKAGLTLQNGGSRLFFYGFNGDAVSIKNVVLFVHQPKDGVFDASALQSRLGSGKDVGGLYAICDGIFANDSMVDVSSGSYNGIHYYNSVEEFNNKVETLPSGFSDKMWTMEMGIPMLKGSVDKYANLQNTITIDPVGDIEINKPVTLTASEDVTWSVEGLSSGYTLCGNVLTITSYENSGVKFSVVATSKSKDIFARKTQARLDNLAMKQYVFIDKGDVVYGLNQSELNISVPSGETVSAVFVNGELLENGYSVIESNVVLNKSVFDPYKNNDNVLVKVSTDGGLYSFNVVIVDVAIKNASEFDSWYTSYLNYTQTAVAKAEDYNYDKHVVLTDNIILSGTKTYESNYKVANKGVIFAGLLDGMGHYIQNLKTTEGMFWRISGTIKNLAVVNTTTTHNYMPFMGYYAYASAVFNNFYYQGTQSGAAWENESLQVNGFYQHVIKGATVKNVVIIVDRITGYNSDPISKDVIDSDSLYVVNTTSAGETQSKKAHYYSSLSAFTGDVITLPSGFSSKYWKMVGGELMFKSIDKEEFVYGKNRTFVDLKVEAGLTKEDISVTLNGEKKTSGFVYTQSTGNLRLIKNNFLGTLPIGPSSVIISFKEKTYNFVVNVVDFAIGNIEEFTSWYSKYKDNLDARITLTDDLDFGGKDIGNGIVNYWWVSDIGNGTAGNIYYNGVFDGAGHTIKNFTENVGFIVGLGENGVIKNLNMTDFITNGNYGLLGCTWQGRVYNCYFEGKNNATETVNGAVCNQVMGNSAFVDVTVVVTSDLDHTGVPAIFGEVYSKMENFIVVNNNSTGSPFKKESTLTGYRLYTTITEKENDIRNYQIVMSSDDADVITATNFIKSNLDRAYTGGFEIVDVEEIDDSQHLIIIGDKKAVEKSGIVVSDGSYIVKKVGNLVFIYATDTADYQVAGLKFLEYVLGFDDLGNQSIVYSNIATEMPDMDYENKVFIKSRITGYTNAVSSNITVHLNANETVNNFDEKYGMGYTDSPLMFIPNRYYTLGEGTDSAYNKSIVYHTAFQFLPPEMYLTAHGAWFASYPGQSVDQKTWTSKPDQISKDYMQLCYTAHSEDYPSELENMKKAVLEYMEYVVMLPTNINKSYLPFMQLDNDKECNCKTCTAKGATLAQLELLDDVIGRLNAWLAENGDDRKIKGVMFAYKSTLNAPTSTEKFNNIAIIIAPIAASFMYDAYSDVNKDVKDNMTAWSGITAETFMWLYQSNFGWAYDYANDRPYKWTDSHGSIIKTYYRDSNVGGYIDYFASVDAHLSWLKLCRECKATFMFDQGSHNAKVSSGFSGLKNYIDSKALIDLDYVIDNYNKVVNDYFTRYFGPAATKMKDVFDKLNSTVKSLAQTYGVGSIRDCLYSKWTKSLLSPITTALDNAYKALNDAYADKTCAEYLEYKRRIDIESITPRFINADQGLGITSSYYTTSKQGVYNDMVALGFDKFAEPATCTIAMLKTLWSVS